MIFRDAIPELAIGQTRVHIYGEHKIAITATSEVGCDSGRRRYRLDCRTCRVVVHPGTTGPSSMIANHLRDRECGIDDAFPGEEYVDTDGDKE